MKKKKGAPVVYIITKLELGGAQKVCLSLFNGLRDNNITSYLITGNDGILTKEIANQKNVFLLPSLQREITLKSLYQEVKSLFSMIRLLRKLKKKHPNLIVHTHSSKAGILGRWAAFFAHIKKRIHTIHNYGFHDHQKALAWLATYLPELLTSYITTHYICVSSENVKTGLRLLPHFARRHTIIRAAVDWKTFYTPARTAQTFPAKKDTPFIFGSVACFKPPKNIFDLLNAFAYAYTKNSRIRLEIIGDGTLRPKIERWIAQHKLDHIITLHGWQDKVAPIMLDWHAFVLSSLWEGLPCAIVEARLLKLPVLSYKTGGIPDVITHEANGLLFDQQDWHALAQGMLRLAECPKTHYKLQHHKDNLIDFNDSHMIQEHIALYRQIHS